MSATYDVKGLAQLLDVSTDWVYTQVEAKAIPHTRLPGGRLIRFTEAHVAQILASGDQPTERLPVVDLDAARAAARARRAVHHASRRSA